MIDQKQKAHEFARLHHQKEPLIIYNVWDGGSAKAVASCGAKAIATGDHPVGYAHGFGDDDFNDFTFDTYLMTIKEIAGRIGDLPLSVDISNGSGLEGEKLKDRVRTVMNAGAVGINFEDRKNDHELLATDKHAERIKQIREAADQADIPLFINARTDLFMLTASDKHRDALDQAIERAASYKAAGANGFFAPGLLDKELIQELCSRVELPINSIRLPGAPSTAELMMAGVARISYGPVPQMEMIEWLKKKVTAALNAED